MWLDTSLIPPRHLTICRASQAFSYRNPDSSSIPGGSIEKAPTSSIASQHLVDRSRSFQPFVVCPLIDPRQLHLSTSIMLDTYLAISQSIEIPLHAISFFFVLHFFPFMSIASCFSFSCRSMVPCSPRSLYVSFLFVSIMSFGFLCPLTIVSKRGRNLRIECLSSRGVIDLRGELHVKGKNVYDVTNLRGELV